MIYILFRAKIADYERWKAAFQSDALWRMSVGEQDYRIYRDVDDPNEITLILGWEDFASAQMLVMSDDFRRKLDAAGVIGLPAIFFLNEVETGKL